MDIDKAVDAVMGEVAVDEFRDMRPCIRRGLEKVMAAEWAANAEPPAKVEAGTKVAYRGGSVKSSRDVIAVYARGTVAVEYAGGPAFLERADAFRVITPATIELGDTVLHAEHGVGFVTYPTKLHLGPCVVFTSLWDWHSLDSLDRADLTILMKAPKE